MSNVGFRIFNKINRPDKALVEGFKGLPVPVIGDEMNRLACMDARIKPLNNIPLLGTAFTVKARTGDNLMFHRAIDMACPGDVIVVQGEGDLAHALAGENMILWALRRNIAGVVVDGAMRDLDSIRKMNFPVFASGVQPKGPYKMGPGEINVPITCGGIVVCPGDIVVGDGDGVVVIRPADAPAILKKAQKKQAQELATREAIAKGTWNRAPYTEEALQKMGCEIIDDVYHD
ncbi:MAG: RraA family protein [Candidatus Korobacteraceae bacterium]|jgi:RraA family protein